MHVGIAVAGKRSRHSRYMRKPQFYVSGKRPNTRHSTESQLGREFSPLGCLRLVLAYNFYFVYGGDMSMSPYDGSRADANYGLIASCDDARFPSHEYSPRTQRHTFTTPSGVQCATQICNFRWLITSVLQVCMCRDLTSAVVARWLDGKCHRLLATTLKVQQN